MPFFDIPTYTACLRRQHATASGLVTGLTFSSVDDRLCALVSSGRLTVARTNYPDRATTTNGVPGYARALCAGEEGLYVAGDFGLLRTAWAGDKGVMLFPNTRVQALVKGEEGVFAAVEGGWVVVIEEGERESCPVSAVGGEVEVGCLCAMPEGGFLVVRLAAFARIFHGIEHGSLKRSNKLYRFTELLLLNLLIPVVSFTTSRRVAMMDLLDSMTYVRDVTRFVKFLSVLHR